MIYWIHCQVWGNIKHINILHKLQHHSLIIPTNYNNTWFLEQLHVTFKMIFWEYFKADHSISESLQKTIAVFSYYFNQINRVKFRFCRQVAENVLSNFAAQKILRQFYSFFLWKSMKQIHYHKCLGYTTRKTNRGMMFNTGLKFYLKYISWVSDGAWDNARNNSTKYINW